MTPAGKALLGRTSGRLAIARPAVMTSAVREDDLLQAVLDAAALRGWLAHHIRRSDRAIQQGNPGFPDVVLARKGSVLFLELKAERGRLTPEQAAWSQALFPHWQVIRPADLDWLLEKLA